MATKYTPTKNGLLLTQSNRLLIPCRFIDIDTSNVQVGTDVALVAYGGRINPKRIGKIVHKQVHNYEENPNAQFLPERFMTINEYNVELSNGKLIKEIFDDMIYPLSEGEIIDIHNYQKLQNEK
jgi:hypothetical protein